ncbi:uncharacterized protein LOC125647961 isoform X2 [Ostrea edulis]|uniref:uncharacterized protein LOC125647961 isoform X2 n=1 Tax=Ostrea edulis TaxID=37623 RepID=UPI0024AE8B90|nr:uncharacterized protein LOC125647961 isoform X2 [Ostrea edulis]
MFILFDTATMISVGSILIILFLDRGASSEHNINEKVVNIFPRPQSWQAAERNCGKNDEKLATFKNEEEMFRVERQLNSFTNKSFVTFWVGGREIKSQWVWSHDQRPQIGRITGCFQGNLTLAVYTVLHNNHPELCTAFCKIALKRQFAALQGRKCYCLYDTSILQEAPIYECNTTCAGNPEEFCGGPNRSSVFPTWDSVEWGLHEPTIQRYGKDCALLMVFNKEYVWSTEYCRQEHEFICNVKESAMCDWLNQPTPCLYVVSEKTDWYTASYKCNQMHGHLVDRDAMHHHNLNLSNVYYWTGLTRTRQIWTDALGYDLEDLHVNGPPGTYNTSHHITHAQTTQTTHSSSTSRDASHFIKANLMYWIVVPTVAAVFLFLSMVLVGVYIKRSRQRKVHVPEEKAIEPFYYILEKQSRRQRSGIYNNIFLDNQYILNYNQLNFKGTLKQLVHDSTNTPVTEDNATPQNHYDTMNCKLHQYDKISHGRVQIYCVQGLYETVM